jgi:hypothetical protein
MLQEIQNANVWCNEKFVVGFQAVTAIMERKLVHGAERFHAHRIARSGGGAIAILVAAPSALANARENGRRSAIRSH